MFIELMGVCTHRCPEFAAVQALTSPQWGRKLGTRKAVAKKAVSGLDLSDLSTSRTTRNHHQKTAAACCKTLPSNPHLENKRLEMLVQHDVNTKDVEASIGPFIQSLGWAEGFLQ